MFSLTDRVALITGSGQGIGRGIAEVFGDAGAHVVVATRTRASGQETVDRIRDAGGKASLVQCDVGTREACDALVAEVVRDQGKLDIMVHNAGVFPFVTVEDLSDADLEHTLAVNLKASFWLTKASLPSMKRQKYGRILFTSSVTGPRVAMPLLAHYAASKAGLNGFIRAASLEFARLGITVNGVEPGYILTQAMGQLATPEETAAMAQGIPLGRLGDPKDIGYAMLYLASSEAAYMTGQTLVVDGGSCTPESAVQLQVFYKEHGMA